MQNHSQRVAVLSIAPPERRARVAGRPAAGSFEASDEELAAVREDVILCRRDSATAWLSERRGLLRCANPAHPNTPALIGHLVQWAEAGGDVTEITGELLSRFPEAERGRLPICSYLFVRFTEGVLDFVLGKSDRGHLDFVITVASGAGIGRELLLFAHFWKAMIERARGALEDAATHARQSSYFALESGYPRLWAKSRALEAFVMLDTGLPHAVDLLRQAEPVLLESEDWLWLSRIHDAFGRAALDEGRYQSAFEHFGNARNFLASERKPGVELGWAHFHQARAQRMVAARLATSIDALAERRRRSRRTEAPEVTSSNIASRQHLDELRSSAFASLAEAAAVLRAVGESRAADCVQLERAALWADCSDLQRAAQYAGESFDGAARRQDTLIMAQARLLQSRIERAHCEEGVGSDLSRHAQRASEYATEALALAFRCEAPPAVRRRLLAAIYVCQGLLSLTEFFNNPEAARECCHSASGLSIPCRETNSGTNTRPSSPKLSTPVASTLS